MQIFLLAAHSILVFSKIKNVNDITQQSENSHMVITQQAENR